MGNCIVTMIKDEWDFFPLWRKYYGQFFSGNEIYVINDGSSSDFLKKNITDENLITLPQFHNENHVRRIEQNIPNSFDGRRALFVSDLICGLLNYFETAIYTDIDEFIVPDPKKHHDLKAYLDNLDSGQTIAPVGINVVHVPRRQKEPLDLGKPILSQRTKGYFAQAYTKPSITRKPVVWSPGFHGCKSKFEWDPDIFMFHLRDMDVDLRHKNHVSKFSGYLESEKGLNSSWTHSPDSVRENYLRRIARSKFLGRNLDHVNYEFNLIQTPKGFFRVADENFEIPKRKRYDLAGIPPRFRKLI